MTIDEHMERVRSMNDPQFKTQHAVLAIAEMMYLDYQAKELLKKQVEQYERAVLDTLPEGVKDE